MRNFIHLLFLSLAIHLGGFAQALAQDPSPQQPIPATPNPLPGQLPDPVQRIEELRRAGVPESVIQDYLSRQSPPILQPIQINPNTVIPEATEAPESEDPNRDQEVEEEEPEEDTVNVKREIALDSVPDMEQLVFGQHLFAGADVDFELDQGDTPSDDYVIDVGDEFTVNIWGASDLNRNLRVSEDGAVNEKYLGRIFVAGRTYRDARDALRQAFERIVSPGSNISIVLGKNKRAISVSIVGSVKRPGTYQIYANNTVFNALFKAGGLSETGTARNIEVRRGGKLVETFDLYEYLLEGESPPVYLKNNDYIFVPVQRKVVRVDGEVKQPMFYELRENENLSELLRFAGGAKYTARTDIVQLTRLENGQEKLIDIPFGDLRASGQDFSLQDGDKIDFKAAKPSVYNLVEVVGAVTYPGPYELEPGDRVMDLLNKAGGVSSTAFVSKAYVTRFIRPGELAYQTISLGKAIDGDTTHNIRLQYFDQVRVFSQDEFKDQKYISVTGHVRNPGDFLLSPTMTLKDLLFLSGGPKEDADLNNVQLAFINRPELEDAKRFRRFGEEEEGGEEENTAPAPDPAAMEGDMEVNENNIEVITRVAINENWQNDSTLDSIFVKDFNEVRVFSKYEFIYRQFIEVAGAVAKPGSYQVKRGMSLKDILYLSGGLLEEADVGEVELYRIIEIDEKGFYASKTPKKELIRITLDTRDWQRSQVADSLDVTDFYKVNFRPKGNFFQQGYVEVKGLVNLPDSFPVLPNMTLKDLFYLAEGFKIEADLNNIELSRVVEIRTESGEVVPTPIVIRRISTDQDWQNDPRLDNITLNSFDQVFVRKNPNFELQESVFIDGEVIQPGEYNKISKSERISSLVRRSGGITELAYLEGAFLIRTWGDSTKRIALNLEKALRRPNSKHDIPMLDGDMLVLPPRQDLVTVRGNVLKSGNTVVYDPSKTSYKYYVNQAGGFAPRTRKKNSRVVYMDGRVKRVKSFLGLRMYPKVEQGSTLLVEAKPPKKEKAPGSGNKLSFEALMATLTSLLTFYILVDTARGGTAN